MRHIANIRLRLVAFLLLMGGALTWTSCSDDDVCYDVGNNEEKEVTVRLSISAGDSGGISVSRADYEDENALDGEYMNTLCVFVVDESNTILAKLEPTSSSSWAGETPEWTSDALTLATGSYTVYAFSNWETVENESWNAIIAKTADGSTTLTESELAIDIDDPASMVDIDSGKYIPMSGKQEITVSSESTSFNVGMDRLVGRVEITIYGETGTDAENVTLNSFAFGNWADIVPLMKGGTASSTITYENKYEKTFEETVLKATTSGEEASSEKFYFYVNETYLSENNHFDITLSTTRGSESSSYTASTSATNIPRNYILPISLSLSTYTLSLDVSAYAGPIGAAERQYYNIEQENEDTYTVTLATVTTWFTMTPSLLDSEENIVSGVSWKWEQTSASGQLTTEVSTSDNMLTASGLTATNGYTYSFDLTATWTSTSGVQHTRTFHINIVLSNYQPNYNNAPAHSSWQRWCWDREQLNMYRRH